MCGQFKLRPKHDELFGQAASLCTQVMIFAKVFFQMIVVVVILVQNALLVTQEARVVLLGEVGEEEVLVIISLPAKFALRVSH